MCPLTPEEAALILQALGFDKETQIYIASGEIYSSERRLAPLRAAFPWIVSLRPRKCLAFGIDIFVQRLVKALDFFYYQLLLNVGQKKKIH